MAKREKKSRGFANDHKLNRQVRAGANTVGGGEGDFPPEWGKKVGRKHWDAARYSATKCGEQKKKSKGGGKPIGG